MATGFHHYSRGNENGAGMQFQKALNRLQSYPDDYDAVDLAAIRRSLTECLAGLDSGEPLNPPVLDTPA